MPESVDPAVVPYLALIDTAYGRRSWHGPNLRGSLRGVTPAVALWRPGPGRHNVWEQVVHCAYWKYIVRRRLLGEKRGSFPLKGSNWFPRTGAEDWEADLALLDETHRTLRAAVAGFSAADLAGRRGSGTVAWMIAGVAHHDVYHAGQINLLKRLAAK